MRKTNALQIQEALKGEKYVTIPWLQLNYDMTYTEAKQFLQQLQNRGWVDTNAEGIRYAVRHKQLCLRKVQRSEVDKLYLNMTNDCILALTCLEKQEGAGATKRELERAIHGDEDTDEAISTLLKHKLIYQVDELYFLTVSKRTVQVLALVEMEKRRAVMRRKISDSGDKDAEIKKLYDPLFEDDDE
ncbi:MAG: hypothetical protein E7447_03375 [Ruminococcaceae bacterium]|nr:hypothetical protein [Oscillospiraceae bacterium]